MLALLAYGLRATLRRAEPGFCGTGTFTGHTWELLLSLDTDISGMLKAQPIYSPHLWLTRGRPDSFVFPTAANLAFLVSMVSGDPSTPRGHSGGLCPDDPTAELWFWETETEGLDGLLSESRTSP